MTNQELLEIYSSNWEELQRRLKSLHPSEYTNPLLLSFDESLLNKAHLRVMIFGQETKGWFDALNGLNHPPTLMMQKYHNFFCEEKFSKGYKKSSFWKAFRHIKGELKKHQPDKEIYYVWNNINKIGKSGAKTGISQQVRHIERALFSVVTAEVKVFNPDIVIFMTGPSRDGDIKHHFPDAKFEPVGPNCSEKKLAKVYSEYLPRNTIRLYHPSFFGGFSKVKDLAVQEILTGI